MRLLRSAAFLILGVLAIAGASVAPGHCEELGVRFGMITSANTILTADTGIDVTPGVRLTVRGPFAFKGWDSLEFRSLLELTGLPGETVNLQDPATFKAVGFDGGLARRIGTSGSVRTFLFASARFDTRLPHDPAPQDRYPRQIQFGLEVRDEKTGGFFRVGAGKSDVAGPKQWRQIILGGEYPLFTVLRKRLKGKAKAVIGGDVVLTWGRRNFGPEQRDVTRILTGVRVGG
jgi:hypothetical protein